MFQIDIWKIILNALIITREFWPILAFMGALIVIKLVLFWLDYEIYNWKIRRKFRKGERWRSDRELISWLRGMKPVEFENYVADLFRRLGYSAEAVGRSHDGGIDVVAEKDGVKHYIQCKKYITSTVSVSAVRDFYGALADHLADGQGYFITTNKFTLEAKKFAEDKPIELIDGFALVKYVRLAEKNKEKETSANASVPEQSPCPECGGTLIERNGKYGKFWGCSNYPKCRFTKT